MLVHLMLAVFVWIHGWIDKEGELEPLSYGPDLTTERIIPFKSIFEPAGAYNSTKRNFWIPGQPVNVRITGYERQEIKVLNPYLPDALIGQDSIGTRKQQLEKYLQNLLQCKSYRNHPETVKFFEVSHLSFVARLGLKAKEGYIKKCSGGRRISIGCCGCLQKVHFAGTWNQRWLVLKDTYLAYVRPEDGIISDVMLMDSDFKVACGMRDTGAKHGVLISNLNRNLLIKCWTSRKAREWADSIERAAVTHASEFTRPKRFASFAPDRENSYARWFVDARSYFEAVAEALEKAKEEIYITDWWLSPEIYLKRPIVDGDHWRLDVILERKAAQGVRVFILLYKEIEAALMIKSIYSKQVLMGKHENIKVLRHPDHIPGKGILLWAHHEKLVAIDQQIAFIGGIDLCYGRWDDGQHRLTDLGSIVLNAPPSPVAPSVISTRREESHVTDMTELTEDLNSLESPASVRTRPTSSSQLSPVPSALSAKTAARVAGSTPKAASHHDVNIKVIPPSPPSESTRAVTESSADDDQQTPVVNPEEIVVKEDASRRHVFAKVLLNSNGEESETETDVDAGLSSSGNGTSTLANSSTVEQESSDADTVREELQSTKSASVDSTTSTGSGKKHLWGNNRLKLKIPGKRGHSQSETPEHANVNGEHGDEVDRIDTVVNSDLCQAEHMPRLRSSSNESMNRGKQEENNNKNRPRIGSSGEGHRASGGSGDGDGDGNSLARRRWKMVFNVQKFESVVRHKQEPERIPEEVLSPGVLLGKDKKRAPTFYQKFKRDNRGSFDVGINDRGLLDILPPGEVGVYRTNSEQDILERGLQGSTKLWIGKDYVNFIHKDFVNLEQPFEDFIDRTQCPRMPWHDIGAVVYGKTARDVARHFIGRWNYTKLLKYKRNPLFPLLLPKTYPKMNIPQVIKDITFSCKAQVLRSLCGWSAGIEGVEKSIHEAYEFCIENAKNYIYIENQFFITQVGDTSTVGNCIGTALFKRILRAYRSGEEFRVYVERGRVQGVCGDAVVVIVDCGRSGEEFRVYVERGRVQGVCGDAVVVIVDCVRSGEEFRVYVERGRVQGVCGDAVVVIVDCVRSGEEFRVYVERGRVQGVCGDAVVVIVDCGKSGEEFRVYVERGRVQGVCGDAVVVIVDCVRSGEEFRVYVERGRVQGVCGDAVVVIVDCGRSGEEFRVYVERGRVQGVCGDAVVVIVDCGRSGEEFRVYVERGRVQGVCGDAVVVIVDCGRSGEEFRVYVERGRVQGVCGDAVVVIVDCGRSGEEFRVYVVMPLLPAFEGEFGTASGASLQAITHWNYVSMCRSESSLIKNLEREVPDPYKYIVFCGLRTWDKLDKKLVTELIYVHSKLMIVDDNTVIIGSANINDRSMLGKRDSELAIIFQDTERERVVSDNHILEPGPFASSLRHTIFREHLGIKERDTDVDLKDITSDTFYKDVWIRRAAVNSSTYDKVFRCLPTDHVHTFQELKQYNAQPNMATTDPDEALTHLSKVQGHLVLMPLMFLKDESLTPRVGQKEALLPSYLWT
ncbi:hypothetical protein BaRGS_00022131 [Batillaria attramentaria]|uniref:phospholipase D n=1 Tax=Batillaria attramentaria TaxID=370345 RepID=A0ABD0KI38_9CAEN